MLKYKYLTLFVITGFLSCPHASLSQNEEEVDSLIERQDKLSIGASFDYLKLHTLLIDESEKWEAAVNLKFYERASIVGEYGIATFRPEEDYKNADYLSEGNYYRAGVDYHFNITPANYLLLGLRYSEATYDEYITYNIENPIFPNETDNVERENLQAQWFEFVISSEKEVKKIFKKDIPDFLTLGFRLRLKSFLEYEKFEKIETKRIPGYGMTNTSLNPEINLYVKLRLNIF